MSALFGGYLALVSALVLGADPLPDPAAVIAELDAAIEAKWADRGIVPQPIADDATFLRRVWLSLVGRVPSPLSVGPFLEDARGDKRARLVEEILAGDEFADYWARSWTIRLTEQRPIRHGVHDGTVLHAYLR